MSQPSTKRRREPEQDDVQGEHLDLSGTHTQLEEMELDNKPEQPPQATPQQPEIQPNQPKKVRIADGPHPGDSPINTFPDLNFPLPGKGVPALVKVQHPSQPILTCSTLGL